MASQEWSRSRYWLCHFLHNRHERAAIAWRAEDLSALPPVVRHWLGRCVSGQDICGPGLIRRAVHRYRHDPAYVQALRLFRVEKQVHGELVGRLAGRVARRPGLFLRVGPVLGVRYTLSAILLADLIDLTSFAMLRRTTTNPTLSSVCDVVLHDKSAHVAFLAERLTLEFADFNFVRRNLRRLRLRAMFGMKLARAVAEDAALIRHAGWSRQQFIDECWQRFARLLEQMVPYHREQLLAALTAQRRDPYARTSWIDL